MTISPKESLVFGLLLQLAEMNFYADLSFQHYRIVCNDPRKLWNLKSEA
jgi:hypothetical protein